MRSMMQHLLSYHPLSHVLGFNLSKVYCGFLRIYSKLHLFPNLLPLIGLVYVVKHGYLLLTHGHLSVSLGVLVLT
jgi:hypothetical protein